MNFIEEKDPNGELGYVLLGLPVQVLKDNGWNIKKVISDDDYKAECLEFFIKEAEKWSGISYEECSVYGYLQGYMKVRGRKNWEEVKSELQMCVSEVLGTGDPDTTKRLFDYLGVIPYKQRVKMVKNIPGLEELFEKTLDSTDLFSEKEE